MATMIAIPAYEGKIGTPLALALIDLCRARHDISVLSIPKRASLSLVRDEIAATFLAIRKFDTLIMIDTDVVCTAANIQKLEAVPLPLVSAWVPYRESAKTKDGKKYTGELLNRNFDPQCQLREAKYLPCSMIKITRASFEAVLNSDSPPTKFMDGQTAFYNWFPCGVVGGRFLSEAYYFTHIMRAGGVSAWIDFDNRVGHAD